MVTEPVVVDFETEAIEARPAYPPKPVGVAVFDKTRQFMPHGTRGTSMYWSWGHPTENNCTLEQAGELLAEVWQSGRPLLFHNAKFDLEVAEKHLGLAMPAWDRYHDTLFSLFLRDPHAPDLNLKPSAERILGMAPDELDAVNRWLAEHGHIKSVKARDAGAFICKAPGKLVGEYAIGDVVRTYKLHKKVYKELDEGMRTAYDRERRLMPILTRNEAEGMRVDVGRLRADIMAYRALAEKVDAWLRKRLKAPDLNLDADADLAEALDRAGAFTEWVMTEKSGKRSTAKGNMPLEKFKDQQVAMALGYRNRLGTVLSMSMEPWLAQAEQSGGIITTSWNQVRTHASDSGSAGTRTGRLSCSRFQNIAKTWDDKDDGYKHPTHLGALAELPLVRQYIIPDKGQVFTHRDYNQQELRILAHFEAGDLCAAYNAEPRLDVHTFVGDLINDLTGRELSRRPIKVLNFGKVYGMGANGLVEKLHCTIEEARALVAAHQRALPGVKELELRIRERAMRGEAIRTWGGRLYKCEEPSFNKKFGRVMTYEYKLLNYLIQGSAADCTKEALIRLHEHPRWPQLARFLVTVHDEINACVPKKAVREALAIQRDVMASVEFDVPMLSDAKVGPSWGELEKYVDRDVKGRAA
jgi:DNA polymerase I-like protein with 3'-5' exonuclease and polymerase domains